MIFLRLFGEFFCTGLFSVGGGLATIPFLQDMGLRTGWFDAVDLANMMAVSESTPGPMGINMATYVGFTVAGVPGCVIATLGLVAPSILVILIIAHFLEKFRNSRLVDGVFYGLRPASVALISSAGLEVARTSLLHWDALEGLTAGNWFLLFHWKAVALFAAVFLLYQFTPVKKLHPILLIAASALAGIVFQM
ncbi:MAG: chromate transporter [Oscillospiraceae bacterium]|nr:chromate transporter [Oscillospiraceae bacterium]